MIRVILLIDCSSEHDRELLRGMMRYSKENGPWLFYRLSSGSRFGENREEWVVEWAKQWKADAIIGRWDDRKMHLLNNLNIPVVLQNNSRRSDVFSNLTGDYDGTGKMAAQYFRKKLYTDYAFFGLRDIVWSEERCEGYRKEVLNNNGRFYSYMEKESGDDREKIMEWLIKLPKPVALFCCDDEHAQFITETCKICNIRVPEDIAILGVDDDELLCSISDPQLSSIDMDVENGGYMACKLLHQLLLNHNKGTFNVSIAPLGIKERASTSVLNVSDAHVLRLVRYIDSNYNREVRMEELLQSVPLSRRSIEMRFKKATGFTIYQYLLYVRVEHLAYLITTTDRSYVDMAYEVGFRDFSNVARTFRKFKGCTLVEYRRKYCVI